MACSGTALLLISLSWVNLLFLRLFSWTVPLVPHLLFKVTWFTEVLTCRQLPWCMLLVQQAYIRLGSNIQLWLRCKRFRVKLRHVKWSAWDVDWKSATLFVKLRKALANTSTDGYPVSYRCKTNNVNLCGSMYDRGAPGTFTRPNLARKIPPRTLANQYSIKSENVYLDAVHISSKYFIWYFVHLFRLADTDYYCRLRHSVASQISIA
jgi:hypothetical protein